MKYSEIKANRNRISGARMRHERYWVFMFGNEVETHGDTINKDILLKTCIDKLVGVYDRDEPIANVIDDTLECMS